MSVTALVLIPVRRDVDVNPYILRPIGGRSSFQRTIDYARGIGHGSSIATEIAVVTNDENVTEVAAKYPDLHRPPRTAVAIEAALQEAMLTTESVIGGRFSLIFVLEPLHPYRPVSLAREAIAMMGADSEIDSVVAVEQLHGRIWTPDPENQAHADAINTDPYGNGNPYRELVGLMLLTRRDVLASGRRLGDRVGLLAVDRRWTLLEVRSSETLQIAERLAPIFSQ